MADISRPLLNWIELDRSIISAIDAMQAARAEFNNSTAFAGRQTTPEQLPVRMSQPGPRQRMGYSRSELVSICFDDAEWLLGEARARMMIARATVSGISRTPADMYPRPPIAAASNISAINERVAETVIELAGAVLGAAAYAKSAAIAISERPAKMISRWFSAPDRKRLDGHISACARSVSANVSRYRLTPFMQTIPARMRRRMGHWKNTFPGIAFNPSPSATSAVVLRIAILLAGAALAVWMLTPAAITSPSPARLVAIAEATIADPPPAMLESYTTSSCTVAAWGKACYPRRLEP